MHVILEKLWAPVFIEELDDCEGLETNEVFFSCKVNAKPTPQIVW